MSIGATFDPGLLLRQNLRVTGMRRLEILYEDVGKRGGLGRMELRGKAWEVYTDGVREGCEVRGKWGCEVVSVVLVLDLLPL